MSDKATIAPVLDGTPLPMVQAWLEMGAAAATILAVIIGGIAGYLAWKQYSSQVREAAEARAKALLADCIRLCIEYPKFAQPESLSEFNGDELTAYQWFVGAQLNMCEEIVKFSNEDHWRHEVEFIIGLHEEWISCDEFQSVDIKSFEEPLYGMLRRMGEMKLEVDKADEAKGAK